MKKLVITLLAIVAVFVPAIPAQARTQGVGIVHNKHYHCIYRSQGGPIVPVCFRFKG